MSRTLIVIVKKTTQQQFSMVYIPFSTTEVTSKCSKYERNHKPHHFYGLYEYGPWKIVLNLLDLGMTVRAAAGLIVHVLAILFCAYWLLASKALCQSLC